MNRDKGFIPLTDEVMNRDKGFIPLTYGVLVLYLSVKHDFMCDFTDKF